VVNNALQGIHYMAGDQDALERARDQNPLASNGYITRGAEHVPLVNNVVQGLHSMANHQDSLERARDHNPLASCGYITRGAERLPLVNNLMQGLHKAGGKTEDLERARDRNPLGKNGSIVKGLEHIPLVADGIHCIHKFRGDTTEAERARAFSLQRMISKQGAITKLAELVPGLNLVPAAINELSGDRVEARKALCIVQHWKEVAGADGALAKVAECIPGCDVIAFGLMLNDGHFASALRAICKTRWVEISSNRISILLRLDRVKDWTVLDIESNIEIQPKAASLAGGLLDLGIHLFDFNRHGKRRWWRRGMISEKDQYHAIGHIPQKSQGVKVAKANEALREGIGALTDQVPAMVGFLIELTNWAKNEWEPSTRTSKYIMSTCYVLFPDMPYSPPPSLTGSAKLAEAIRDSLVDVTAFHRPIPLGPNVYSIPPRLHHEEKKCGAAEAAAAVSCMSFVSCLAGFHSCAPVACLAGCAAAVGFAHWKVKQKLSSWINSSNAAMWEWMSASVEPLVQNVAFMGNPKDPEDPPWIPASSLTTKNNASSKKGKSHPRQRDVGKRIPASAPVDQRGVSDLTGSSSIGNQETTTPMGIVFHWPAELIERLDAANHIRSYVRDEFLNLPLSSPRQWLHPMCWVLQFFELQLRRFLNDALDGRTVPVIIPIPLPAGVYNGIWLPDLRIMLILWFRFTDQRYVTEVAVAIVDGMLEQMINVIKSQLLPEDLRELDPRLNDFTEPIKLTVDFASKWIQDNQIRIDLNGVHTTLHLPE